MHKKLFAFQEKSLFDENEEPINQMLRYSSLQLLTNQGLYTIIRLIDGEYFKLNL